MKQPRKPRTRQERIVRALRWRVAFERSQQQTCTREIYLRSLMRVPHRGKQADDGAGADT